MELEEIIKTIPARVQKGIEWLNAKDVELGYRGDNRWFMKIDLDTLALESACSCVLGQTAHHLLQKDDPIETNGYCVVVDMDDNHRVADVGYLLSWHEADDLGFNCLDLGDGDIDYDEYAHLTEEWKTQIAKLQNQNGMS